MGMPCSSAVTSSTIHQGRSNTPLDCTRTITSDSITFCCKTLRLERSSLPRGSTRVTRQRRGGMSGAGKGLMRSLRKRACPGTPCDRGPARASPEDGGPPAVAGLDPRASGLAAGQGGHTLNTARTMAASALKWETNAANGLGPLGGSAGSTAVGGGAAGGMAGGCSVTGAASTASVVAKSGCLAQSRLRRARSSHARIHAMAAISNMSTRRRRGDAIAMRGTRCFYFSRCGIAPDCNRT